MTTCCLTGMNPSMSNMRFVTTFWTRHGNPHPPYQLPVEMSSWKKSPLMNGIATQVHGPEPIAKHSCFCVLFGQFIPIGLTLHCNFPVGHMHQSGNFVFQCAQHSTPSIHAPFWLQDPDSKRLHNHVGATCTNF